VSGSYGCVDLHCLHVDDKEHMEHIVLYLVDYSVGVRPVVFDDQTEGLEEDELIGPDSGIVGHFEELEVADFWELPGVAEGQGAQEEGKVRNAQLMIGCVLLGLFRPFPIG
jgi:hypothetical protein